MKTFVLAQYSTLSKYNQAEINRFASNIFHDARDEHCSCELILERFAAFRSECVASAEAYNDKKDEPKRGYSMSNISQPGSMYSSVH